MIALFNEKQRDSDNNVGFPKEKNHINPIATNPKEKKSRKPKTEKGNLKNQKLFKNNPNSQRFNKTPETLNKKGNLKNQKLFKNNPTSQRFNKTPETLNNI